MLHKGQPNGVGLDGYGLDKHDARALADVALAAGFHRSEPQGEPSDAAVSAALESYWGYPDGYSRGQFDKMRAALRAANNIR